MNEIFNQDTASVSPTEAREICFTCRFADRGEHAAMRAAERFLNGAGFSVGRLQGPAPRGIMFGDYDVQKWRNLNDADRRTLHGQMTGDMRNGPVQVIIFASAPPEALRAVMAATSRRTPHDAARAAAAALLTHCFTTIRHGNADSADVLSLRDDVEAIASAIDPVILAVGMHAKDSLPATIAASSYTNVIADALDDLRTRLTEIAEQIADDDAQYRFDRKHGINRGEW